MVAAVVQSVSGPLAPGGNLTLPGAPTVGNSLVALLVSGAPPPGVPGGWSEHPAGMVGNVGFYAVTTRMIWRPVAGGDGATISVSTANTEWATLWEVTGSIGSIVTDTQAVSTLVKPATVTSGSVTTSGPALILSGVNMAQAGWGGTGDHGIDDDPAWVHSGKHEVTNPGYTSGNDTGTISGPVAQAAYKNVSGAGTYSPNYPLTGGPNNFGGWGGIMMAIEGPATPPPPPPVVDETGDDLQPLFPIVRATGQTTST
jgi:hypothetical protein